MTSIIEFINTWQTYLTTSYEKVSALKNINFQVSIGERIFVTGHSGAGKSTLFKLISLIEKPSHGKILISGQNLSNLSQVQAASYRQQIALVPQNPMLLNDRNVIENVFLGLEILNYKEKKLIEDSERALAFVQLEDYKYVNPQTLSAGEQQRVALARALARRPKILLADEPTGNLDPEISKKVMLRLLEMNEQSNTTLIIATHEATLVKEFCEKHHFREIKLHRGAMLYDS